MTLNLGEGFTVLIVTRTSSVPPPSLHPPGSLLAAFKEHTAISQSPHVYKECILCRKRQAHISHLPNTQHLLIWMDSCRKSPFTMGSALDVLHGRRTFVLDFQQVHMSSYEFPTLIIQGSPISWWGNRNGRGRGLRPCHLADKWQGWVWGWVLWLQIIPVDCGHTHFSCVTVTE